MDYNDVRVAIETDTGRVDVTAHLRRVQITEAWDYATVPDRNRPADPFADEQVLEHVHRDVLVEVNAAADYYAVQRIWIQRGNEPSWVAYVRADVVSVLASPKARIALVEYYTFRGRGGRG